MYYPETSIHISYDFCKFYEFNKVGKIIELKKLIKGSAQSYAASPDFCLTVETVS